jgi:hypothetical protein
LLIVYTESKELKKANGDVFFEARRAADNTFISVNWIGIQSLETIVMGGNCILSMLREKACQGLLNSNRELVGPWEVGVNWLGHKWAPQVKALGLQYFAHVLSPGIYGQRSFQSLAPIIKLQFEVRSFDNEEGAEAWLEEKS